MVDLMALCVCECRCERVLNIRGSIHRIDARSNAKTRIKKKYIRISIAGS